MNDFAQLADASYISIESNRKNGDAVRTPVWFTADGDKVFYWTLSNSGKVKRIRGNPRVRLARCSARGEIADEWIGAVGRVHEDRTAVNEQSRRMSSKYGLLFQPIRMIGVVRGVSAVVIEFSPA